MKTRRSRLSRTEWFLLGTPLLVGAIFAAWLLGRTLLRGWFPMKLQGSSETLVCLAWSPDGKWIAAGGGTASIRSPNGLMTPGSGVLFLWNTRNGALRHSWPGQSRAVMNVAFSPDGRLLASRSYGGVTVWNVDSGALAGESQGRFYGDLAFSSDSRNLRTQMIAPGTKLLYQTVQLDIVTFAAARVLGQSPNPAAQRVLSPDQTHEAVISQWNFLGGRYVGGTIEVRNTKRNSRVRRVNGDMFKAAAFADKKTLRSAAFLTDDAKILGAMLCEIDISTGKERWRELDMHNPGGAAFSRDGSVVAIHHAEQIRLFDAATGLQSQTLTTSRFGSLAFSPDSRTLAYIERSAVRLFDLK